MRKAEPLKYIRAIAAFIGVLILFQVFAVYFILSAQRKLLLQAEHNNISHGLDLMAAFVREPILSHDYVMIEQFLLRHGEECKWAVELKATAPNGFVLAHYKRHKPAVSAYKLDRKIKHTGKHLITLSITNDLEPIETILGELRFGLIASSLLLTAILGIALWFTLRKMALVPLEKEIELRKKAEEKIEHLFLQNKLLLDSTAEAIYGFDNNGYITFVNPAAERLTGWTANELMGQQQHKILKHSNSKGVLYSEEKCRVCAVIKDKISHFASGEILHKKDGTSFLVEYISAPMIMNDNVMGGVVAFQDITEREQKAKEREKLIKDLTKALAEVKALSGLLPICASCKKIRDDKGYWNQIEAYIRDHSEAEFSHSICPECVKKLYPDFTDDNK